MRPLIAIPARFSSSAAALRFEAEVAARKLVEAVYAAGGEPLIIHPAAPDGAAGDAEVAERLEFTGGVLLPGGGDLHPAAYGGGGHDSLYDLDREQDAFDLAVARWCLRAGRPLLAICRGLQVVNVAVGGTLIPDMPRPHRHHVSELILKPDTTVHGVLGQDVVTTSCYHHQAVDRLGARLRAAATSADGVVEAIEADAPGGGWFLGVQWHPEDTAATDPAQQRLFAALVTAAAARVDGAQKGLAVKRADPRVRGAGRIGQGGRAARCAPPDGPS
ncbi:MAG: type 1 glutamine amidotransferase [Actinobacteria bacterium]|nr:type 1 glutamine amidotransferase [Actinomycetota bacterium]